MTEPARRVFDCFLFNGEIDALEIRLHELDAVVDVFVLIEGTLTFSGRPKPLFFREHWERLRPFWPKLRCIVVDDWPEAKSAWDREVHQRNAVSRALLDAEELDLVLVSDVDEIPRAEVVRRMREDVSHQAFGLRLSFRYFALNYCNVTGPEAAITWTIAILRGLLRKWTPDQLRYGVRDGSVMATILDEAGWHFSYLGDEAAIRRKIASFSHQEFNTPEFLGRLDIKETIRQRGDLFGRPGFVWKIIADTDLPSHIRENGSRYAHLLLDAHGAFRKPPSRPRLRQRLSDALRWLRGAPARSEVGPVIICPYVHDVDALRVRAAFRLDEPAGRHLPFFLWQDKMLIGPERAFEACWEQFPGRDVVIVHPDMRPLPDDHDNAWFGALRDHVVRLPDAGIVACDLLYPDPMPNGALRVQCAGGLLDDGRISHLTGMSYDAYLRTIREAAWITFGGIYIRREVIDLIGPFDRRYQWAYVMDVDYSLEVRRRGYRLYQVPVNLLHEENGTTREFLARPGYSEKVAANHAAFVAKWGQPLAAGDFAIAAPLPTLLPGEKARFSVEESWSTLLGAGWSQPEPWGVWSDASEAFLQIAMPPNWHGPARLTVEAQGFTPPDRPPQRVAIRSGIRELGEWRLEAKPTCFELTVPQESIRGNRSLLTLSFPDATSPHRAGQSSDNRQLGMGLIGITLLAPR